MIFELNVEEVHQVSGAGSKDGRATGGRETNLVGHIEINTGEETGGVIANGQTDGKSTGGREAK